MISLNGCTFVKLLKAKGKVTFFLFIYFFFKKTPQNSLWKGCASPEILISD